VVGVTKALFSIAIARFTVTVTSRTQIVGSPLFSCMCSSIGISKIGLSHARSNSCLECNARTRDRSSHMEQSQGARAAARMVRIWILDDEHHGLVVAGRLWKRHCGVSGALLSEEAQTCFVLPRREAVAHFARRNTGSTPDAEMGGSDNGDAHASNEMRSKILTFSPRRPFTDTTNEEKCRRRSRQTRRHFNSFSRSLAANILTGSSD
jgi:hypothetical protein